MLDRYWHGDTGRISPDVIILSDYDKGSLRGCRR
jgi:bifunctional ADP-heptose synthase (sugar kinase/adenylyltransferase)